MSKTSASFKFTLALITLCTGTGTGTAPPASGTSTTAPAPAPYTQGEAQAVAGVGFLGFELIAQQAQIEQPALAYFTQGFLSQNTVLGSTGPTTASCASATAGGGTLTVTVTKSGTYAGLKTNDKIDVTFTNCDSGAGNVQNGRLVLTAQADYANLGALNSGFKFNYQLSSINYAQTIGTARFVANGVQNVQFDSTASATYPKLSSSIVSAYSNKAFSPASATTPGLEVSINAGTTLTNQFTSAGANYSATVDGGVGLTTPGGAIAMAYATTTPITGAVVSGRLVPAAGVLRVKETTLNLQTESTVQGSMVQVKADTNRDGTLDLTFSTTYSLLTN
jgi:hypothetical protein